MNRKPTKDERQWMAVWGETLERLKRMRDADGKRIMAPTPLSYDGPARRPNETRQQWRRRCRESQKR